MSGGKIRPDHTQGQSFLTNKEENNPLGTQQKKDPQGRAIKTSAIQNYQTPQSKQYQCHPVPLYERKTSAISQHKDTISAQATEQWHQAPKPNRNDKSKSFALPPHRFQIIQLIKQLPDGHYHLRNGSSFIRLIKQGQRSTVSAFSSGLFNKEHYTEVISRGGWSISCENKKNERSIHSIIQKNRYPKKPTDKPKDKTLSPYPETQRPPSPSPASAIMAGKLGVKQSFLGISKAFLSRVMDSETSTNTRPALDELFSSYEGRALFTAPLYPASEPIKSINNRQNSHHTSAAYTQRYQHNINNFPINKTDTIEFITLFKQALENEKKPSATNRKQINRQAKIKSERVNAINDILRFVQAIHSNHQDAPTLCRLAIQLCGRVREGRLVAQHDIPLCGGFSILRSGWAQTPRAMVKVALKSATAGQGGRLPSYIDRNNEKVALADQAIVFSHYPVKKKGSTVTEDKHFARKLNLSTRSIDTSLPLDPFQVIQSISQITEKKATVEAGILGELAYKLSDAWRFKGTRKPLLNNALDVDALASLPTISTKKQAGHAVTIEKLSYDEATKKITAKVNSWGESVFLRLSIETFSRFFSFNDLLLVDSDESKNHTFNYFK